MADTHLTAPTRHVEVDGSHLAYRRWGNASAGQPPLFFLQHFRGGMDHWDPLMSDGLAAGREVLLFNGRGVASRRHPDLVRKLMLLGTGPRGGAHSSDPGVLEAAPRPVPTVDDFLYLFFGRSEAAKRAGRDF